MRYAVFGPRELRFQLYTNKQHVAGCLGAIPDLTGIIAGGGKGVEALAEAYAKENGIDFTPIPPNYQSDSGVKITAQQVFDTRNLAIINEADAVVVFWDGLFAAMVPLLQRCMVLKKRVILCPVI
ncbi:MULTISPECIES: hypothetical protein [unclassified Bradyrhizobium]|uniref:hypothetical protein n=1 Tax=unclassified Bradyrhizobium TaxID=2631580 RepID=UPI0033953D8D